MGYSKACIFNVQRFSLHDGPGIRSVVFFKGCPLKCKWCSNPESQKAAVEMTWDRQKCSHCNHCIHTCTEKAVAWKKEQLNFAMDKCTACFACVNNCPSNAIGYEGAYKTMDDIITTVMKDTDFYIESGGGVTLSGGEVLYQAAFASELLKQLKKRNIHTACETTGFSELDQFKLLIENTDLLLFDIKHYDDKKHIQGAGVSNKRIIENLKYAIDAKTEIIARIPVIPEYNNSLDDAYGFCKFLKQFSVNKVHLLPFHQFGSRKYDLLGLDYELKKTPQLHREDLKDYYNIFCENNFEAKL